MNYAQRADVTDRDLRESLKSAEIDIETCENS